MLTLHCRSENLAGTWVWVGRRFKLGVCPMASQWCEVAANPSPGWPLHDALDECPSRGRILLLSHLLVHPMQGFQSLEGGAFCSGLG